MLAVLVSDELRSFQWLVSGHTTGESHPPIGRDQLEHVDRTATHRLLEQHYGAKQAESITRKLLLRTVPALCTYRQRVLTKLTVSLCCQSLC